MLRKYSMRCWSWNSALMLLVPTKPGGQVESRTANGDRAAAALVRRLSSLRVSQIVEDVRRRAGLLSPSAPTPTVPEVSKARPAKRRPSALFFGLFSSYGYTRCIGWHLGHCSRSPLGRCPPWRIHSSISCSCGSLSCRASVFLMGVALTGVFASGEESFPPETVQIIQFYKIYAVWAPKVTKPCAVGHPGSPSARTCAVQGTVLLCIMFTFAYTRYQVCVFVRAIYEVLGFLPKRGGTLAGVVT